MEEQQVLKNLRSHKKKADERVESGVRTLELAGKFYNIPTQYFISQNLGESLEKTPEDEKLKVLHDWVSSLNESDLDRSLLKVDLVHAKKSVKEKGDELENKADRQQREILEKAVREKLKLRADDIGKSLESERDFMHFTTYSSLLGRLKKLQESLNKHDVSPNDLQQIQTGLDAIRDEMIKASDEGYALFNRDKETLANSIGLLHDKIQRIKDLVSEMQVKSWEDELEEIGQRVDRGNLNVKEVVELGRRINRLNEEIDEAHIDAERKSGESFLTNARSEIELLPADFEERNEFVTAINDLIDRLKTASTIEEFIQIREEFNALIEKRDSAYEQYLLRKEDEEFPKTLSLLIEALKTGKGRTNLLRNLKNAVLGKTEDDSRNRLKHLAIALCTSGATLAGLSVAHPDPWLTLVLATGLDSVIAASAVAYPIVGSGLEQGEQTHPKFRELSTKLAKKVSRRRAPNLTLSRLMQINRSNFMKVIVHTQPIVFAMATYGTLVGGAEMLDVKAAALQQSQQQSPQYPPQPPESIRDNRELPNPGIHITYPSTPAASVSGSVDHPLPPPIIGPEVIQPGLNGIDWSNIQGNDASTKIWNYLQHEGGFSHLGPDVNGVKNLLVELAQLHDPSVAHGNVNEVLKSLEHVDIKKMAQVLDALAHGDAFQVQQLKNYYGDALIQTLQRSSTGLHGVSAPKMYLSNAEADMIQMAFTVPPVP